jgi:tetratricopeptide (TPR) repeat protein
MGILAPVVWKAPPASVRQAVLQGAKTGGNDTAADAEHAGREAPPKEPLRQAEGRDSAPARGQGQPPLAHGPLWPFSPEAKEKTCEYLARLEPLGRGSNRADHLLFYASWISYLTLETLPSPACGPENAFRIATDAIARRELCGRGYAFLAAYYAYKRVPDRARSFLEEGLQASQPDPWVRLVEGVFSRQVLRDGERATRILDELLLQEPSFAPARYHLARICLEEEDYGKARELFRNLEQAFPQQQAFAEIRQSLAMIEGAPYYTAERAKGLLDLSRALSGLPDYRLAERICRSVLENMPEDLPRETKKSTFYDLGRISEITGDRETAFTCYQNALRIDPFYRDARERLGSILKGYARTS